MKRIAETKRKTKETDISMKLCLDGTGTYDVKTGIGFFDHMLEGFAKHGNFDLNVKTAGDLNVDTHHTVEDTGIVLGETIKKALGNKENIFINSKCSDDILINEIDTSSSGEKNIVITHKKYGRGTVVKTIKYENRQLLQIEFEEAGKKLLDPKIAGIELE